MDQPVAARDVEPGASWAFTDHAALGFDPNGEHSPLGASGAERWMNCPGSVELIKLLGAGDDEGEDPEYRRSGSAEHALGENCLRDHSDTWEHVGAELKGWTITSDNAVAVQVYLDCIRGRVELLSQVAEVHEFVESYINVGHVYGWGKADHVLICGDLAEVTDYKGGAGIWVDVVDNVQLKYYAWGKIKDHPEVRRIKLRIVQPNCAVGKPVREWEVSREGLQCWVENELLPAMDRTEIDKSVNPGSWCRFCPAKLVCPAMKGMFAAAATANPSHAAKMTIEQLKREWTKGEPAMMYWKAIKDEIYTRLNAGTDFGEDGPKLVYGKADRVWHAEAEGIFRAQLGTAAYTEPALKSPAQMEKVPGATALVKQYAYAPQGKLTVVGPGDKRVSVSPGEKAVNILKKHLTSAT